MTTPIKKIDSLTGIRAFASYWVILFHASAFYTFDHPAINTLVLNGGLGVDLFFVLSGFILSLIYAPRLKNGLNIKAYKTFIIKRLARIYPLHLATLLGYVLLIFIAQRINYQPNPDYFFDGYHALLNLLLVHGWNLSLGPSWNAPSWSISAEWFAYLFLFPLCMNILRRQVLLIPLLLVILFWALYDTLAGFFHVGITFEGGVLRIIPEFLAGYLLYRLTPFLKRIPYMGTIALIAGFALLMYLPYKGELNRIIPLIFMLIIYGVYQENHLSRRLFANPVTLFLGEISYAVYLVHLPFQSLIKLLTQRHILEKDEPLTLIIYLMMVTLAAWFAFIFIEKKGQHVILLWWKRRENSFSTKNMP
ncbi:acyltransferase family protein [Magnetococcales bacterium HHB-1]